MEINLGFSSLCIREFTPCVEAVSGWVHTRVAALIYRNAVHSVVHLEMYLPYTVPLEESAFLLTIAPVDRVVGAWEQKLKCENLWS